MPSHYAQVTDDHKSKRWRKHRSSSLLYQTCSLLCQQKPSTGYLCCFPEWTVIITTQQWDAGIEKDNFLVWSYIDYWYCGLTMAQRGLNQGPIVTSNSAATTEKVTQPVLMYRITLKSGSVARWGEPEMSIFSNLTIWIVYSLYSLKYSVGE